MDRSGNPGQCYQLDGTWRKLQIFSLIEVKLGSRFVVNDFKDCLAVILVQFFLKFKQIFSQNELATLILK